MGICLRLLVNFLGSDLEILGGDLIFALCGGHRTHLTSQRSLVRFQPETLIPFEIVMLGNFPGTICQIKHAERPTVVTLCGKRKVFMGRIKSEVFKYTCVFYDSLMTLLTSCTCRLFFMTGCSDLYSCSFWYDH